MAIKKSVRLVDETIKILNNLTEHQGAVNWSGSINKMAEQFGILITENLPILSDNEKNALYCMFNGYHSNPVLEQELQNLPWQIDQSYQYDSQVTDLLGTPEQMIEFRERAKKWTNSEKLAVIYFSKSYWRKSPIVDD